MPSNRYHNPTYHPDIYYHNPCSGRSYLIVPYTIISCVFLPIRHRYARPGQPISGVLSTLSALCRLVRHSSAHCICLAPACPAAILAWHLPAYSVAPRHTLLCTTLSSLLYIAQLGIIARSITCISRPLLPPRHHLFPGRGYRQYANSSADAIVGQLFVEIDSGTKHSYNTYHKAGGYETNTPDIPHRSMASQAIKVEAEAELGHMTHRGRRGGACWGSRNKTTPEIIGRRFDSKLLMKP